MAKKKGMVNFVQESQDSSDAEESVLKVEDVSSVETCGNRWFAMPSFYCGHNKLETKLKCQLDTAMFLVTEIYQSSNRMATVPQMESSKTKLKLFDGSLIRPLGKVNLQDIHGGQTQVLKFQVVSGNNKPSLSAETCQKLGLLKLGSQTEVLTLDVKQAHLTAYLARLSRCLQRIGTHRHQQLCGGSLSNTSTAHLQTYTYSAQEGSESKARRFRKKRHHRERNSPNRLDQQYGCGS